MSELQNEQAKKFLLEAEDLMRQEKYSEAITHATAGLDVMFTRANEFFFGAFPFKFDTFQKLNDMNFIKAIYIEKSSNKPEASSNLKDGIKALKDGVEHSVSSIKKINETTICNYLNINIEQYIRYRKMAGYVQSIGGKIYSTESGLFRKVKFNFDKKDAKVSLDYCAKTITDIQEALERLNKPLSEE